MDSNLCSISPAHHIQIFIQYQGPKLSLTHWASTVSTKPDLQHSCTVHQEGSPGPHVCYGISDLWPQLWLLSLKMRHVNLFWMLMEMREKKERSCLKKNKRMNQAAFRKGFSISIPALHMPKNTCACKMTRWYTYVYLHTWKHTYTNINVYYIKDILKKRKRWKIHFHNSDISFNI